MDRSLGDGGMALLGQLGRRASTPTARGGSRPRGRRRSSACNPVGHGARRRVRRGPRRRDELRHELGARVGRPRRHARVKYSTMRGAKAGDALTVRGEVVRPPARSPTSRRPSPTPTARSCRGRPARSSSARRPRSDVTASSPPGSVPGRGDSATAGPSRPASASASTCSTTCSATGWPARIRRTPQRTGRDPLGADARAVPGAPTPAARSSTGTGSCRSGTSTTGRSTS